MDILQRAKLVDEAEKDPDVAAAARQFSKNSIIDFLETFGWIYEPRPGREHHVPVVLYPHEVTLLKWLEERYKLHEDGLVEKSRDMGVTWTVAAFWGVWHWLFDDDFDFLVGSRKEDLVDNRLPDSIFGKISYFIEHLPSFIKPLGWDVSKYRNHMKIVNPENGNSIVGEATNPEFSRSGRYSAIFLDEFAFVEKSHLIWQACGDSTDVRIPVSTPNGKGNKFADLALGDQIQKLSIHWRLHPDKDDAWYEKQKSRRTPEEIAQELDISYEQSQKGRVFGNEWDEIVFSENPRLTHVPYDPTRPVFTSWDFGSSVTAIGFYQVMKSGAIHMIDYYEGSGYAIDHYIKVVRDREAQKGYSYAAHYGDRNVKNRELGTGRSVYEILKESGITIRGRKIKSKADSINASKLLLRRMYVDKDHCEKFVDAIENYHYEWDDNRQDFKPDPYHDWSSHACDQLNYFAVNYNIAHDPTYKPVERIRRSYDPKKYRHAVSTY